jgi:spore coat protein CotH
VESWIAGLTKLVSVLHLPCSRIGSIPSGFSRVETTMAGLRSTLLLALLLLAGVAHAQFGGGRFGVREDFKIQQRYDKDGDGVLNAAERRAALADFGFDTNRAASAPATGSTHKLSAAQVRHYTNESLYDAMVVRTLFLKFDTVTWEDELAVFKNSDVKVPATLSVDGKTYPDIGVSFRGQTSFMMVGAGQKRSMNLDINFVHKEQRLLGNKKLTLLNSAADPTFLRSVMFMHIARDYYPASRANYVRVVINGEDWGIYINQQPVDDVFALANGGSTGPIWQVPGTPRGRGGLEYLGEDPAPYQSIYELKDKGAARTKAEAWTALVRLCRVLNQTPTDKLPAAIAPLLDVDATLRFLAVDNALLNSDAYYSRASDYSMYVDAQGRFRFVAHDVNESLRPIERGMGGWRRRGGAAPNDNRPPPGSVQLDPLEGATDTDKALLYRLLAVPEYRQKYLGYVRAISERWLNWERFGAVAEKYQALIAEDVKRDQRKLYDTAAFHAGLATDGADESMGPVSPPGMSLKSFVEQRRAFLQKSLPPR